MLVNGSKLATRTSPHDVIGAVSHYWTSHAWFRAWQLLGDTDNVHNVIGLDRGYHGFPHSWLITEMPKYIYFYKSLYYSKHLIPTIISYDIVLWEYCDALNAKERNKVCSLWACFFRYFNRNSVSFSLFQDVTCCDFIIDCTVMWRHVRGRQVWLSSSCKTSKLHHLQE